MKIHSLNAGVAWLLLVGTILVIGFTKLAMDQEKELLFPPQWKETSSTSSGQAQDLPRLSLQEEMLVEKAATDAGINPDLFVAIALVESGGNPNAVGEAGEIGLFQITDIAHRDVYNRLWKRDGSPDPLWLYDPVYNAGIAAFYLEWLFMNSSDVEEVLASYNWGRSKARNTPRSEWPDSVQQYIKQVLSLESVL